jgi:hypothetical protein
MTPTATCTSTPTPTINPPRLTSLPKFKAIILQGRRNFRGKAFAIGDREGCFIDFSLYDGGATQQRRELGKFPFGERVSFNFGGRFKSLKIINGNFKPKLFLSFGCEGVKESKNVHFRLRPQINRKSDSLFSDEWFKDFYLWVHKDVVRSS